jgi:hypothetical protein
MDPYAAAKERPLCVKGDVAGEVVVVFGNKREDRGLHLISTYTRVVLVHEIHEFIITDEKDVRPGCRVDRVAYLCYAEIKKGGAIMFGDRMVVENRRMGEVVGFEETHMPNHMNIIIHSTEFKSGLELNVSVGQQMLITDRN